MKVSEHILRTSPIVVSATWLALVSLAGQPGQVREFGGPAGSLYVGEQSNFGVLLSVLIVAWCYALDHVARQRALRFGVLLARRVWLFVAACSAVLLLSLLAHTLFFWRGEPPSPIIALAGTALVLGVAALFGSLWTAAKALEALDARNANPKNSDVLGTFFLIALLPIGVWFMQNRIRALLSSPASATANK